MALISSNTAASTRLHQRGGFWAQQHESLDPGTYVVLNEIDLQQLNMI